MVFMVRFIPPLRGLIAFLAGANQMSWRRFLSSAASGSLLWASIFGFGPYWLGKAAHHLARPLWISLLCAAVVLIVAAAIFIHRNEARLEDEAEKRSPARCNRCASATKAYRPFGEVGRVHRHATGWGFTHRVR
jgi:hypothetical protein